MTTDALITLTTDAAARLGGKLWPNRSGFDARGWEYCYSESRSEWYALKRNHNPRKGGYGPTPEAAKQHAQVIP